MATFHNLTIADVRRETPDAVSIAFDVPPELADAYRYQPGQYLVVRTEHDGEELRRNYSICSGLDEGELRIAVKRVPDGRFSTLANDRLKAGMQLDVMTPGGRFTTDMDADSARSYVAFAAGSGITPIMALAHTLLAREPGSTFTLFYGNRTTAGIIFRERLEALKDRYLERFSLFHILSREGGDVPRLTGRLDAKTVSELIDAFVRPADVERFFLCGPGDMIPAARQALLDLGVERKKIRFERFTSPDAEQKAPAPQNTGALAAADADAAVLVEIILDGVRRTIDLPDADANIIDTAHAQGIELPFSCRGGMCCTCRSKIIEGKVEMAHNYSLEPWELEQGYILTCQAKPASDKLVLDFDSA